MKARKFAVDPRGTQKALDPSPKSWQMTNMRKRRGGGAASPEVPGNNVARCPLTPSSEWAPAHRGPGCSQDTGTPLQQWIIYLPKACCQVYLLLVMQLDSVSYKLIGSKGIITEKEVDDSNYFISNSNCCWTMCGWDYSNKLGFGEQAGGEVGMLV